MMPPCAFNTFTFNKQKHLKSPFWLKMNKPQSPWEDWIKGAKTSNLKSKRKETQPLLNQTQNHVPLPPFIVPLTYSLKY